MCGDWDGVCEGVDVRGDVLVLVLRLSDEDDDDDDDDEDDDDDDERERIFVDVCVWVKCVCVEIGLDVFWFESVVGVCEVVVEVFLEDDLDDALA